MERETLELLAELLRDLGGNGFWAFIIYLVVDLLQTIVKVGFPCLMLYWIATRMWKGLFNYTRKLDKDKIEDLEGKQ